MLCHPAASHHRVAELVEADVRKTVDDDGWRIAGQCEAIEDLRADVAMDEQVA